MSTNSDASAADSLHIAALPPQGNSDDLKDVPGAPNDTSDVPNNTSGAPEDNPIRNARTLRGTEPPRLLKSACSACMKGCLVAGGGLVNAACIDGCNASAACGPQGKGKTKSPTSNPTSQPTSQPTQSPTKVVSEFCSFHL